MTHRDKTLRMLLPCSATCLLISSCLLGGVIDKLDNAADCNAICNRYKDCVDGQRDLVACVEHCQHSSSGSDRFMKQVNDCESCIDSSTCDIATKCQSRCASVLP